METIRSAFMATGLCAATLAAPACVFPEYTTADTSSSSGAGGMSSSSSSSSSAGGAGGGTGGSGGECPQIGNAIPIACNQANPEAILISEMDIIYWANRGSGTIMSAPKAGGPIAEIASGQGEVCGLAMMGNRLVWRTFSGTVASIALSGGSVEIASTSEGQSCIIDADSNNAYWFRIIDFQTAQLMRNPLDGTGSSQVVAAMSPNALEATDPAHIYWIDAMDGKAWATPKSAGMNVLLDTGSMASITVDVSSYYVSRTMGANGNHQVMSGALATPFPNTQVVGGLSTPSSLSAFNTHVYWVSEPLHQIQRAPKTGAANPEVVVDQEGVCDLAVDGSFAYFTTCEAGGGNVMKIAHN